MLYQMWTHSVPMTTLPKWLLVMLLGIALAFSGCVVNDNDDGDDGDDGDGGVTVSGEGEGDNDDDGGTASAEARGTPGWGLLGSLGAIAAVGYLIRRK